LDPVRELEKWNVAQSVRTVNAAVADSPDRRPLAEIECLPGSAEAGTATVTGPKVPAGLVVAEARWAVPKKMPTPSAAPNPAPETRTLLVGGPVPGDRARPGVTVNVPGLVPVPPGVVTEIGPVEAAAGTAAVILVPESTVNVLAAPLNITAVAPVNPDPFTVTAVPIVPEAGLKEEMTGAAALAGDAAMTAAPRMTASAPSLDEGRPATLTTARRIRPRITTPTIFWPDTAWQGK
jgi:hypothetical protein